MKQMMAFLVMVMVLALGGCATLGIGGDDGGQLTAALQAEAQILGVLAESQRFERLRDTHPELDAYLDAHEDELLICLSRGVVQYVALRYDGVDHDPALTSAVRIGELYASAFYGLDLAGEYATLQAQEPDLPLTLRDAFARLAGVIVLPPL